MWYTLFLQGNGVSDVTREMGAGSSLFNAGDGVAMDGFLLIKSNHSLLESRNKRFGVR